MTERSPRVQRAAATFRWTGSWHTVFVTADRAGGLSVDAPFEAGVRRDLEPLRMAGYDLEVDGPQLRARSTVGLHVCVAIATTSARTSRRPSWTSCPAAGAPAASRGSFIRTASRSASPSTCRRSSQRRRRCRACVGERRRRFERQRETASSALDSGVLHARAAWRSARLDNDPNFPEHGVLELTTGGGK